MNADLRRLVHDGLATAGPPSAELSHLVLAAFGGREGVFDMASPAA